MATKRSHPSVSSTRQRNKAEAFSLPLWSLSLLFAITTLVFFYSQIAGSSYFWEDIAEAVYPIQTFAARHLANGTLPFWNPYTFSGMPFLADVQVGFFYPGNMLLSLFVDNGHLPIGALQLLVILHFFIAQFSMARLARHWGISSLGSAITAVSYAFSGILVCHAFHPMMVYHLAWFPLILLHFDKALTGAGWKHTLAAGLFFGITMLAGHPQTTLYIALFLLLLTLWHGVALLRSGQKSSVLLSSGIAAAAVIAIAVGLFVVQYIPSTELAALSERNQFSYEQASEGSLQFKQVITMVVPKVFGSSQPGENATPFYLEQGRSYYYWETNFYFGIAALLLGLVGFATSFRTRIGSFLLFTSVFAFLFALGSNSFLHGIFFHLPLFGSFRMPTRMMFYAVLGFAAMAGYGFDALAKRSHTLSLPVLSAALGLPLLIAIGVATGFIPSLLQTPEQMLPAIADFGTTAIVLCVAVIAVVVLLQRGILSSLLSGVLLVLITFVDLYMFGAGFNQSPDNPEQMYTMPADAQQAFIPTNPDSLFRVKMREGPYMAMKRNQGMMDNIMLYEGYNPLLLARRNPPTPSVETTLDLLNIRYAMSIDSVRGGAGFVARTTYFPRARMLYHAEITTPDQSAELMKSGSIDFTRTAVLERPSPLSLPNAAPSGVQHSVRTTRYTNNEVEYSITTAQNGILCLSEIWYPAWQTYVDGQPAELLRVNYSLRGVAVPAGTHTVTMVYKSSGFAFGALFSLGVFLATTSALVWLHLRDKKTHKTATVARHNQ